MNEQALRELCAEFGWTGVGAEHDLARWLRDRLEEPDELRERIVELELYAESAGDCETCGVFETENERLRGQVADVRAIVTRPSADEKSAKKAPRYGGVERASE